MARLSACSCHSYGLRYEFAIARDGAVQAAGELVAPSLLGLSCCHYATPRHNTPLHHSMGTYS
ncbi:hypothetical protein E2C01_100524 [Portunus trituberculatus]|uniref:Uncharacterized protein n=1 Tax=Portunus trituberculatus TaxID=210409 RepID=A0A5B7KDI6_PORTR|nr:hypothetical protein [Portunus trituberculatus]